MGFQNQPNIRDAEKKDYPAIAAIYNEAIHQGDMTFDTEPISAEEIADWIDSFAPREVMVVMEHRGTVIGWGMVKRYSDRAGYRVCCETSVFLTVNHTRKGYGTLLKRAVIVRCRHYGYHHLFARMCAENRAGIAYNRKLGYEIVGTQRQIGYLRGKWRDVVIMQLILDDVPPFQPDLA